jgi:hypothetical protein
MKPTHSGERSNNTAVISYRLDTGTAGALADEAEKLGVSSHELARRVLLEWLTDQERHQLRRSLARVRTELLKLRADLKEAVIAILCDAGKIASRQDAEDWVKSRLFQ